MSDDLLEKFQDVSYTEQELSDVITFVWSLDDKHPQFWTGVCKKLIITMMKDRLERNSSHTVTPRRFSIPSE